MILNLISKAILNGDSEGLVEAINQTLEEGKSAEDILNKDCIPALTEVGRLYEVGEFFLPEMLVSARAVQAGLMVLRPHLIDSGIGYVGKVVIGTVKGDLHDIGKNLVAMMLEGSGFEIIDLGVDVPPEKFVEGVEKHQPDLVGMSALLTTTMPSMELTMKALRDANLRDRVKVIVGGAPLTDEFAKEIGADGFAPDASKAVGIAKSLLKS